MALGDNPLAVIQSCTSTKLAWKKLQLRYASKSTINELSVLSALFKLRLKYGASMGMEDHVLMMEVQFSRMGSMGSDFSESMEFALII